MKEEYANQGKIAQFKKSQSLEEIKVEFTKKIEGKCLEEKINMVTENMN